MGWLEEEHRLRDEDGYPQWAVRAMVSHDNGETWDLDHQYVLARWSGQHGAQSTSTVLLPDGSLVTALGSGYCARKGESELSAPHEVCLVRWRPESL
jgi:hypothetical protein